MITINKNYVFMGLAAVSLLIAGTLVADYLSEGKVLASLKLTSSMPKEAIAQKAIEYINENGFVGQGQSATIESILEESGLIKIQLKIGENNFESYATKDGKLLFPTAFKLDEPPQK